MKDSCNKYREALQKVREVEREEEEVRAMEREEERVLQEECANQVHFRPQPYLTESVFIVVLQKSIPAQIRQLILQYCLFMNELAD